MNDNSGMCGNSRSRARDEFTLRWHAYPESVYLVRTLVTQACEEWGLARHDYVGRTIMSELATNAGAPRGALSYPRFSREELEGGSWV